MKKKDWNEFRSTGLFLFVNQFLHIFGWALVLQVDGDEVINVYPARVEHRGFDRKYVDEAYKRVSEFMHLNSKDLKEETED
jgi:hypothetical protein